MGCEVKGEERMVMDLGFRTGKILARTYPPSTARPSKLNLVDVHTTARFLDVLILVRGERGIGCRVGFMAEKVSDHLQKNEDTRHTQ
jgi:hypothetical protein